MHVDEAIALVAAPTSAGARGGRAAVRARQAATRRCSRSRTRSPARCSYTATTTSSSGSTIRKGHETDAELDDAFARAAQVIEGTYRTVAAGADVHRAAGDDRRVGRRALLTSSARCSARTTCTRRSRRCSRCGADGVRIVAVGDRRRVRRQGRVSVDARRARRAAGDEGGPPGQDRLRPRRGHRGDDEAPSGADAASARGRRDGRARARSTSTS